jgi:RNA polymerase sigma-70 factor (ECF subfamily)
MEKTFTTNYGTVNSGRKETAVLNLSLDIENIYKAHVNTVYRVCFTYMKNAPDTEDCVSDTFIKLMKKLPPLENAEHEKAWLIRTAANICKDSLKHSRRKNENLDDYAEKLSTDSSFEVDDVSRAVTELPDKYKSCVYLHYFEGYTSVEIAKMLKKTDSTVRYFLAQARKILKERLGDDYE